METSDNAQGCSSRAPRVGESKLGEAKMGEREAPLRLSPFRMLRMLDSCRPPGNRIGESWRFSSSSWSSFWFGFCPRPPKAKGRCCLCLCSKCFCLCLCVSTFWFVCASKLSHEPLKRLSMKHRKKSLNVLLLLINFCHSILFKMATTTKWP